jgi:hypothetical protein
MANEFVARNGVIAQNNSIISGSFSVTGSTDSTGSGHIVTYNTASGLLAYTLPNSFISNIKSGSFGITIEGNGGVITVGQKGYITIPYNGTITDWEIFADRTGACNIDIKKSTYAGFPTQTTITGSAPITMSAAQKASSSALTDWTSSISAGDVFGFTLNSVTSITRLNLIINTIKS